MSVTHNLDGKNLIIFYVHDQNEIIDLTKIRAAIEVISDRVVTPYMVPVPDPGMGEMVWAISTGYLEGEQLNELFQKWFERTENTYWHHDDEDSDFSDYTMEYGE